MLDPIILRLNPKLISKKLARRGFLFDFILFSQLESKRKNKQIKLNNLILEYNRNEINIKNHIKYHNNFKFNNEKNINLKEEINLLKKELKKIQEEIYNINISLPNIPDDLIPDGIDQNNNIEISRWGIPKRYNFKIKDHVELGEKIDGFDFSSAIKMSGSRFIVKKGNIARLYRALTQFMLNLHIDVHGYLETYVPYLVKDHALYGTGQLPKFQSDLFYVGKIQNNKIKKKYILIPTSEVSLINIFQDRILSADLLPIRMVAHSPCFRSEAGSYGKDTRGLIRMHQFDKIELIHIVHPNSSNESLEELTNHAEKVLKLLQLPYRKILLCTGDLGYSSSKTYDLEVWIPSQNTYREVSSCSNTKDFQSRRIKIRFKNILSKGQKNEFVHTLNGSGLAVGRTLVAIMENYQEKDGKIKIPKVLRPYMNYMKYI
ncbi:MAG: serine--tRNA ligase [Arsenophonus sp.]|nr:MAG: serine--tRNA ligase [Arsenophonus sp.]